MHNKRWSKAKPPPHPRRNLLPGQVFGEWTVVSESDFKAVNSRNRYWICRCSCGTVKRVMSSNLTRGQSTCCTPGGHAGTRTKPKPVNIDHNAIMDAWYKKVGT